MFPCAVFCTGVDRLRITDVALKANLGVQYRTLLSNYGSVGAGRKVGFQDFAQTIAARVR